MMKRILITLMLIASSVTSFALSADTLSTESGLQYFYVQEGTGDAAISGYVMITHYVGSFTNGDLFDSSRDRDEPFVFTLGKGQVIPGMDEAVSMMRIGDRMTFILPANLAYGEKGAGEVIPPNTTLVFDVELLDMMEFTLGSLLYDALTVNAVDPSDTTLHPDVMFEKYNELAATDFEGIYRSENDLNQIGYLLLEDYPEAALEVFRLNVDLYPESFNPYDSLGEAYMKMGEKDLAIINYAISLQYYPGNKHATEMIQKLQAEEN